MAEKKLEVFQDLYLRSRSASTSIRDAILRQVKAPWRHDSEREQEIKSVALKSEDVIALVREPYDDVEECGLALWQDADGNYRVSNIVPRKVGYLGITKYNAVLQDFANRIGKPAARAAGFEIELTAAWQTLEDWLDAVPADSLRRFSSLANKSTGAAHPRDRERWFQFLIDAHQTHSRLDPDLLARWLSEVEDWPADTARELAIDYEVARDLLEKYDQTRR